MQCFARAFPKAAPDSADAGIAAGLIAGYEIVEFAWNDDWEYISDPIPQGTPGNIQNAACRPATFLKKYGTQKDSKQRPAATTERTRGKRNEPTGGAEDSAKLITRFGNIAVALQVV
ncbi:MAG TPA: hypothetical protein VGM18_17415 [Candidatus Sulfotelmatobacter sp.]|jgi:hypothetical protein